MYTRLFALIAMLAIALAPGAYAGDGNGGGNGYKSPFDDELEEEVEDTSWDLDPWWDAKKEGRKWEEWNKERFRREESLTDAYFDDVANQMQSWQGE